MEGQAFQNEQQKKKSDDHFGSVYLELVEKVHLQRSLKFPNTDRF